METVSLISDAHSDSATLNTGDTIAPPATSVNTNGAEQQNNRAQAPNHKLSPELVKALTKYHTYVNAHTGNHANSTSIASLDDLFNNTILDDFRGESPRGFNPESTETVDKKHSEKARLRELKRLTRQRDRNGRTRLMIAALLGDEKAIGNILKVRQTSIFDIDQNGMRPLDYAMFSASNLKQRENQSDDDFEKKCERKFAKLIQMLGGDIDSTNKFGQTIDNIVSEVENTDARAAITNILRKNHLGDVMAVNSVLEDARNGSIANIKRVLRDTSAKELVLNAHDAQGNTPLHIAVMHGQFDTVAALIELGANINAVNKNFETPLHLAVAGATKRSQDYAANQKASKTGNKENADNANVKSTAKSRTDDHLKKHGADIVALLLKNHADSFIKTKAGSSALDLANSWRHNPVYALIRWKQAAHQAKYNSFYFKGLTSDAYMEFCNNEISYQPSRWYTPDNLEEFWGGNDANVIATLLELEPDTVVNNLLGKREHEEDALTDESSKKVKNNNGSSSSPDPKDLSDSESGQGILSNNKDKGEMSDEGQVSKDKNANTASAKSPANHQPVSKEDDENLNQRSSERGKRAQAMLIAILKELDAQLGLKYFDLHPGAINEMAESAYSNPVKPRSTSKSAYLKHLLSSIGLMLDTHEHRDASVVSKLVVDNNEPSSEESMLKKAFQSEEKDKGFYNTTYGLFKGPDGILKHAKEAAIINGLDPNGREVGVLRDITNKVLICLEKDEDISSRGFDKESGLSVPDEYRKLR